MNINLVMWEIINENTGFVWYIGLCAEKHKHGSDVILEESVQHWNILLNHLPLSIPKRTLPLLRYYTFVKSHYKFKYLKNWYDSSVQQWCNWNGKRINLESTWPVSVTEMSLCTVSCYFCDSDQRTNNRCDSFKIHLVISVSLINNKTTGHISVIILTF